DLLGHTPTAVDRGRPRLWVDRSFAAKGSGTVVTGTLTGGELVVDEEVTVVGPHAGHARSGGHHRGDRAWSGTRPRGARIRGLQSHGQDVPRAAPGRRLAVNLTGLRHEEVGRGDALIRAGQWAPTTTLDATLTVLAGLDHEVSRRGAYQAYVGSGEHPVRLRILGAEALAPGETGLARLHLPLPLPLLPGDRYVLRESGRSETVGGGEVLDVAPVLPASRARPDRSVDRVVAERGWVEVDRLERLTGERRTPNVGERWVVDPIACERAAEAVRSAVGKAGPLGLDLATLDQRHRALAAALPEVVVEGGRARPTGTVNPAERLADHPYLAALEAAPFQPPPPEKVDRAELRELVRNELVVERDGVYFAPSAVTRAGQVLARLLAAKPDGVTVAEIRDQLGTTRRFLLPLLAHLDATGVTRRRGDLRVGGPKLPAPG
ncbi:MAG TPA: SelB C-terminal domain-containing protein, partial [Acidimicrobiales bacterium]|nr:SelB C-terminal domain-containing protein [Acidimicrobiales bacterium]